MDAEKTIQLNYYARLRELSGCETESLNTGAPTARDLYSDLRERYNFPYAPDVLKVAINDEFQDWDTPLQPGDRVVFIPPVAGG